MRLRRSRSRGPEADACRDSARPCWSFPASRPISIMRATSAGRARSCDSIARRCIPSPARRSMACAVAGAFCVLDRKMPPKEEIVLADDRAARVFGARSRYAPSAPPGMCCSISRAEWECNFLWPFRAHWSAWDLINDLDLWTLLLLVVGLLLPMLFGLVNEEVGARKKGPGGQTRGDRHVGAARCLSWLARESAQPRGRSAAFARISRQNRADRRGVSRVVGAFCVARRRRDGQHDGGSGRSARSRR